MVVGGLAYREWAEQERRKRRRGTGPRP
jgi:hypothetical protein